MNRRHFLVSSAAAVAARSSALGSPNDTVRVACVGVRGQGHEHLEQYGKMKNVEIAAICDIDESVLNTRLADVEKMGRKRPASYTDVRKLLEDKSIDAISIATPNHSHTLQTIWACQAGKHVYVEKPCSHDMFEARQIVAAAQKYNRLVQHGTNSRSGGARSRGPQPPRGNDRRCLHGPRTLLQMARHDRPEAGGARTRRSPLRSLARPGARARIHAQPFPLQLALVLGLRQRRFRQPGHSPGGCLPLGTRREIPDQGDCDRRALHVRR